MSLSIFQLPRCRNCWHPDLIHFVHLHSSCFYNTGKNYRADILSVFLPYYFLKNSSFLQFLEIGISKNDGFVCCDQQLYYRYSTEYHGRSILQHECICIRFISTSSINQSMVYSKIHLSIIVNEILL